MTACVEKSRLPRVERAMAGVEEAVRIERDAGGAFKREMYDAMEAKAAEHKQLLAKLRSELSGQVRLSPRELKTHPASGKRVWTLSVSVRETVSWQTRLAYISGLEGQYSPIALLLARSWSISRCEC